MGRILVDRTMEMLITSIIRAAPLRLLVGRARYRGVLVEQDGIYGALHTSSKDGALIISTAAPTARRRPAGVGLRLPAGPGRRSRACSSRGRRLDGRPDRRQAGAVRGDRGRDHARQLQAAAVAAVLSRPLAWARLGRHPRRHVDVMAQWVREPQGATRMEDLGTLTVRYAANEPNLADTTEGASAQAGPAAHLPEPQPRHRLRQAAPNRERFCAPSQGRAGHVTQLATVIGLWNFAERRTGRSSSATRR
jgi:hypothetical protein